MSRSHRRFTAELAFWSLYKAQQWLDSHDASAAASGNLEEKTRSSMLQSWIARAGYDKLDEKISKASPKPKTTATKKVTQTKGGKREVSVISGVMANGFNDFVGLFK